MMSTNPAAGIIKCLGLFLFRKVVFFPEDVDKQLHMPDGEKYRVFRHVRIKRKGHPEAIFIIRFQLKDMDPKTNERFSRLPMLVFMGFKGFTEKYWGVQDDSGKCQGIYYWERYEDALAYSRSVAVRFMTERSLPGSVNFEIHKLPAGNALYELKEEGK